MAEMKDRFIELWKRLNAKGSAEQEFARLNSMYSRPNRFYHNLKHIQNCLEELDCVQHLVIQPNIVELALWYHDAIYDTQAKDNEQQSAQFAYGICLAAQLPETFANRTRYLILTTKHNSLPNSNEARTLVDIDLSILGRSKEEFDEYEANIRREYDWVPEEQFRQGRSKILKAFTDRESIYFTDFFKKKYEAHAQVNLKRSIEALS